MFFLHIFLERMPRGRKLCLRFDFFPGSYRALRALFVMMASARQLRALWALAGGYAWSRT